MSSYQLSTYLESYLDSIATLPFELKRNFTLMRELDSRSEEKMRKIEHMSNRYVRRLRKASDPMHERSQKEEDEIYEEFDVCVEYADEKVGLAMQTYEMIDKHIRKLDQDLRKVEGEIALQDRLKKDNAEKRSLKRKAPPLSDAPNPKRLSAPKARAPTLAGAAAPDMPVDPHEPVYCTCRRVSYGEMVGCDNPDCKIEWFHFACVGLSGPPKGKWVCADCAAARASASK